MGDKQLTIIEAWNEMILADYLANMDSKGITASGNTKRLSKVVMRENGGGVEVPLYNKGLIQGRNPNANQNPDSLRAWVGWAGSTFLKDWVEVKGIDISPYAVAWKIARQGWAVPNRYNDGQLVNDTITDQKKSELLKQLGNMYLTEIKTTINDKWQQ